MTLSKKNEDLTELYIENDIFMRILVTKDNEPDLLTVSIPEDEPQTGDLYMGIIKSVNIHESSVFLDIGAGRNAYSYFSDKTVLSSYSQGQKVLCEILREQSGRKGAKCTLNPSVTDSYVSIKRGSGIRYSGRCKRSVILDNCKEPSEIPGFEITVRSLSMELQGDELNRRIERLHSLLTDCQERAAMNMHPFRVYRPYKDIMDVFSIYGKDIHMVHSNDPEASGFIASNYPSVHIDQSEERDLFSAYGLENRIEKLRSFNVPLKNGGNLTIEESEALTFIDVDSGKGYRKTDILSMNMAAASEIARQIRLRNLSGIILCDFINMDDKKDREKLLKVFQDEMEHDICKSTVYGVTSLGLIEVSRRRRGNPLSSTLFFKEHPQGFPLSCAYLTKILRRLLDKLILQGAEDIGVKFNPVYSEISSDIMDDIISEFPDISFTVSHDHMCETVSVKRIYG